jgi:hypothetical protein
MGYVDDILGAISMAFVEWLHVRGREDLDLFDPDRETASLMYALQKWVEEGECIKECGGDYTLFLRFALATADAIEKWEPICGKRLVIGLKEEDDPVLNPDWRAYELFKFTNKRK